MKQIIIIGTAVLLSGCVVQPARTYYPPPQPYYPPPQQYQQDYQPPVSQPVVSVYVEPPLVQPAPVLVAWAPPPMLVESPPPMPYDGAIWTGGYWVWEGNWVWAHGRWAGPPQPGYGWVNPYYEHRNGAVVFVNGFWAAPGVTFVAPPMGMSISVGIVAAGVVAGPRCHGPEGVFVPPPPGSHFGLIVPAPIGTSPAVVTSAPPIINPGMHITTINNVKNVTNITNVTIVAPAGSTANGQAVNSAVPAQPHLAAAMTPVVHAYAPEPVSNRPIPAYVAGRQPAVLPQAQPVHNAPSNFNQSRPAPQQQQQQQPQSQQHQQQQPQQQPQPQPQQHQQQPQQVEPRPQQVQQKPIPAPQPQNKEKKEGSEKKPDKEHEHEHERER